MGATYTAGEILKVTNGKLVQGHSGVKPGRLVWNIDEIVKDDWFVARSSGGEDTHDNLKDAFELGAQGCLVNARSRYCFSPVDARLIAVSDTNTALLQLATNWSKKVTKKIITVTGTTDRKSTISLLEFLLRRDYRCHTAVEREDLGCIPDILSLPQGTDLLLAEVSGIQRGEVARKGSHLAPDVAVITTCNHPLPSKDSLARVAAVNLEILETIDVAQDGTAIIYDDNPAVQERASRLLNGIKAICYSQDSNRFSKSGLKSLVDRLGTAQTETKVEVSAWCALTAAVCLGFSLEENPHIVSEVIVSQG